MEDIRDLGCVRQFSTLVAGTHHLPLWKPYMFSCLTKDDMLVCLKYCLDLIQPMVSQGNVEETHARTLENSEEGDMTKLSFVLDHDIRCWILWSSNMLL